MINQLLKYAKKPVLFEKSTSKFWDDPHISKYMLEAHLNPEWDAASRRPETIDKTVAWINDNFLKRNSQVLDLGCGPGLYAERLSRLGHTVTGVDFSRRSIEYAKESSQRNNLGIEYIYKNYLEIDYNETYDLIILIYCDFGALSNDDRNILLKKIYKSLKPGGIFIFDVFNEKFPEEVEVKKEWSVNNEGFWSAEGHILLSEKFHYPEEKVFLDQNIVIKASGNFEIYRTYDHYYSDEAIISLLDEYNFKNHGLYRDIIKGSNFASNNVTFAVTQK